MKPVEGRLLGHQFKDGLLKLDVEVDRKGALVWGNMTFQAHLRGDMKTPIISMTAKPFPKPKAAKKAKVR